MNERGDESAAGIQVTLSICEVIHASGLLKFQFCYKDVNA